MVTKAVVTSINRAGNRCVVHMPLFENASSTSQVKAEALISITPGLYNNLFVGDVVFVAFEENAIEKPIIIGKLFTGTANENKTRGGAGILNTLRVKTAATVPSSTLFEFPENIKSDYEDFETPKKLADYLKWLEAFFKKLIRQSDEHFRCFKNWTQWQLKPQNVEIDDGDIDDPSYKEQDACLYQGEDRNCDICGSNCVKKKTRTYLKLDIDKKYPNN